MNKNLVIFVLVVLTVVGSIWGSVANKKKISLERELNKTVAELKQLNRQSTQEREQVLGKTAGIQEALNSKEDQLIKARKELVDLRKASQSLEAKLSGCNASVQKTAQEKAGCLKELQSAKRTIARLNAALEEQKKQLQNTGRKLSESKAVKQELHAGMKEGSKALVSLRQQLESANRTIGKLRQELDSENQTIGKLRQQLEPSNQTIGKLRQELDSANAQIVGLEKIVDEKSTAHDEAARKMDRMKINMDVLLSKIAEQRNILQKLQEENSDLAKELASRNETMTDPQEEVNQTPVRQ